MFHRTTHLFLLSAFLLLSACFLIPEPAHAGLLLNAPTYTGLNQGLVGYWSFNGQDMAGNIAFDRSPVQNRDQDRILSHGSSRAIGKIGQGIKCKKQSYGLVAGQIEDADEDGNNDDIEWIMLDSYSVSAWFKPVSLSSDPTLFFVINRGYHEGLFYQGGDWVMSHWIYPGPTAESAISTQQLSINTWYHLVGVVDRPNGLTKLYVNGVLKNTDTWTPNAVSYHTGEESLGPCAIQMDPVSLLMMV